MQQRRDTIKLAQSRIKKMEHYFGVVQQCSQLIRFERKEMIQYYNIRGVAYTRLNNYTFAIDDFNKGIELLSLEGNSNPALFELFLFNRAMVYFMQRDYVKSAADLDQVAFLNPAAAYPCFYQGVVCFDQGNKVRALTYFLFALLLDSGKDRQENMECEDKENQSEVDDRQVNFGVLLNYFSRYTSKEIYKKILSFPYEHSIALLEQCKDPGTFLGNICAELREKEKEEINAAINYQVLRNMGITHLFALHSSQASEKHEFMKVLGERRMLTRSQ